ncbi:MAG: GNAT family N-acetyltransferase [Acidimicrobiales bacterium]
MSLGFQERRKDGSLPGNAIASDRVVLRALTPDDIPALYDYHSRASVHRYLFSNVPDEASFRRQVMKDGWDSPKLEVDNDVLRLGVIRREGEVLVGDVMLRLLSVQHRRVELGWIIHPEYQGHGYATEAAHLLIHYAFEIRGMHRVVARIDSRNLASRKVIERLGMTHESHLRANLWVHGEWTDEDDFAMLESEWRGIDRILCVGRPHPMTRDPFAFGARNSSTA